jgi:hypothetical protein
MLAAVCAAVLPTLALGAGQAGGSNDARLDAMRTRAAEGKLDATGASELAATRARRDNERREAVAELAAGLDARLNSSNKLAAACFQHAAKCPEAIATTDALLRPAYLSLDAMIKKMPASPAEPAARPCPLCGGTGRVDCLKCRGLGKVACTHCKGTGVISLASNITPRTCPYCRGKVEEDCPDCGGKGTIACKCGTEPDRLRRKTSGTSEYLPSGETAALGRACHALNYLGLVALEMYGPQAEACMRPSPAAAACAARQSAPDGAKPPSPPRNYTIPKGPVDRDKATGLPRGKSIFD